MRDLLVEELFRGWEMTQGPISASADAGSAQDLCEPPPLHRRHASWALVTIEAAGQSALDDAVGRARGRMRALIAKLEELCGPAVHAWPRAQYADEYQAGYVIGLGVAAVDRDAFAEVAERWSRGASGVSVEWAEGGAVGSPAGFGMLQRGDSRYGCVVVSPSV